MTEGFKEDIKKEEVIAVQEAEVSLNTEVSESKPSDTEVPAFKPKSYLLGIDKDTGMVMKLGYQEPLKPQSKIMMAQTKPVEIEWLLVRQVEPSEQAKILGDKFNPLMNPSLILPT